MKTIQLGEKEYPFLINNEVYEKIQSELDLNPFNGDLLNDISPKSIGVMAYHAIKAGGEEVTREDIGKMSTVEGFRVLGLFQADLLEAMQFLSDALPKKKEGGKKE